MLDVMALTRMDPSDHPMRQHIAQRWHLSADSKLLTIRLNFDYPDSTGLNRFPSFGRTEIHRRIDSH